jgi:hypothetical protein
VQEALDAQKEEFARREVQLRNDELSLQISNILLFRMHFAEERRA